MKQFAVRSWGAGLLAFSLLCGLGFHPALVRAQEEKAAETKAEEKPAETPETPPAAAEAPKTESTTTPAAPAAETVEAPAAPAPVLPTVQEAALAAHNAWMLTSAALVLFMTAPGLAMFYGGLVRKKNVLSVIMQCIFLMGLMTCIWALYGYSLAFGGADPYLGNGEYLFMRGIERQWDEATKTVITPEFGGGTPIAIPLATHMLFQGMFFIITPALICGAFAERMKFSTMVVFSILWGTIVYCPLCHWVWDGGILAYVQTGKEGAGIAGGALDFAGGTVVHISSGVSALICALLIGKRLNYGTEGMPPHNLTYTALGAGMLWVGWFGFNAGSELASDGLTSAAFMNTHFSAASGTLAWAACEWLLKGKPTVLGACSGAVAGLVCITPAAGYVSPMSALIMGVAVGVVCFWSCSWLKHKLGYDDSLDAFGVHGVGGTLGAILTGVFATRNVCDPGLVSNNGHPVGLVDGEMRTLIGQIVAVVVTWVFAAVVTFILLKILDATMGLRISADDERQGLDQTAHGEEGYIFL